MNNFRTHGYGQHAGVDMDARYPSQRQAYL